MKPCDDPGCPFNATWTVQWHDGEVRNYCTEHAELYWLDTIRVEKIR